jgi:ABC-type polysaccharide/polyol phosphate export permease
MHPYLRTCMHLVYTDLMIYKQLFIGKVIDLGIWVSLNTIIVAYVMPFFGLSNFGPVQFGGTLVAVGFFEVYSNVIDLVSDIEGNRVINYALTLPIPSALAFASKSASYFLLYVTLASAMLPIGFIWLWNTFDFTQISYYKLILAILFQSLFYSCFVLWIASVTPHVARLGSVWRRFISPMWLIGGFQFSWQALYAALPPLAYLNILNPMIYITECTRVALLGQPGYTNFWLCLLAITFFSGICFAIAIRNLKRRLDFV